MVTPPPYPNLCSCVAPASGSGSCPAFGGIFGLDIYLYLPRELYAKL
jgi:hypothetical protein